MSSQKGKSAFLLLLIVVGILALLSIACDDAGDITSEIPRFGDGLRIGEALEKATCEATGGIWSNRSNRCHVAR